MGNESTFHRTPSKAPHPIPLPAGEGDLSSARREAASLIPLSWGGMLFPFPSGEGKGEGPMQNDNMSVVLFG